MITGRATSAMTHSVGSTLPPTAANVPPIAASAPAMRPGEREDAAHRDALGQSRLLVEGGGPHRQAHPAVAEEGEQGTPTTSAVAATIARCRCWTSTPSSASSTEAPRVANLAQVDPDEGVGDDADMTSTPSVMMAT